MTKYKAIIFDFDNTLFDSTTKLITFTKEFLKTTPYKDWNYRDFLMELTTSTGTSPNIDAKISDKYWEESRKIRFDSTEPFPEDEDALDILYKNGFKMGICSRSSREKIDSLLSRYGLTEKFLVIVDKAQKPDTKYLLDAIDQLKVKKGEVLYVGDEPEDIEMGMNAGVDTVYCLREQEYFQETYQLLKDWFEKNKPTYTISNLKDLVDILKN